ncbi:porin [Robbsia andropogonis]|uniref:porin n=1 Tax=Robbsia andropogonis TaxID=28092 RepID=UPI0020A0148F|nr:porin [Robbsia andropogonis]MCP1128319.1 porin [Robbsia andropogonis]
MNKSILARALGGAILALAAQHSFAQSSVTLYGIVDTSIRYLTNANAANDSQTSMGVGPITGSRWGLKGSEDLGGGLSAIFRLENGFNLWNGAYASSGTEFNRMSYVGLASKQYGTLTFGRQNTPLFDQLGGAYDPLTVGNYDQDGWLPGALGYGLRANNSVKYNGTFGGLNLDGMYAFGNTAGSTGANNMYGFTATYTLASLSMLAGYQQNSDAANRKYRVFNVGATYAFTTDAKAYAGWLHSQDNTGMVDIYMASSGSAAASLAVRPNTNRIDDGFYVGATYQVTAPLMLSLAGYYDHARNAQYANATLGRAVRYSAVLLAEYSLSKRTEVYATVDFQRGTGAAKTDFPGRNNQTGVAIGLRNVF